MESGWKEIVYKVFLVLLAGAVVSKFVFVLKDTGKFHTAALYVGVPTLLAVLLGYGARRHGHHEKGFEVDGHRPVAIDARVWCWSGLHRDGGTDCFHHCCNSLRML